MRRNGIHARAMTLILSIPIILAAASIIIAISPGDRGETIVAGVANNAPAAAGATPAEDEGDSALLLLAVECREGEDSSCDELFHRSGDNDGLRELARTCDGRRPGVDGGCTMTAEPGAALPFARGDDEALDALWDQCEGGDMAACDDLFWSSPLMSDYEHAGERCGDPAGSTVGRGRCSVIEP